MVTRGTGPFYLSTVIILESDFIFRVTFWFKIAAEVPGWKEVEKWTGRRI